MKNYSDGESVNALMNMVAGQGEGSGKTLLSHNGKGAVRQKNGISEDGLEADAGHGARFFQVLRNMMTGGGRSDSRKSAHYLLLRAGQADPDAANDRQNRIPSNDTVQGHIFHRMGKSETKNPEILNTDSMNNKTRSALDAALFSGIGIKGDGDEAKSISLRNSRRQHGRGRFDVPTTAHSKPNEEKGKISGNNGVHHLDATSDRSHAQETSRLKDTKISNEKGAGTAVHSSLRGRRASISREAAGVTIKQGTSESSVNNLPASDDTAVIGKRDTNIRGNARHGQPSALNSNREHGSAVHASAGETISEKTGATPAAEKVTATYAGESQRLKVGKSGMSGTANDQAPELQKQGAETTRGKMNQQFMVRGNTGQEEDSARRTGFPDESKGNDQRMRDILWEPRLNDRASEGRHAPVNRIDAQTTVHAGKNDQLSIKSRDIINQVTTTVQAKLGKGFGHVKIELNPPHLGSIDLDLFIRDNKVHVILRADQYEVRQLLQSNSDLLKTALNTQGLVAETIDVSLHDRMGGNGFQFDRDGRLFDNRRGKNHGGDNSGEKETSPDGGAAADYIQAPSDRADGRISLFA